MEKFSLKERAKKIATCLATLRVFLPQRSLVAPRHVTGHPVQRGVEESRRAAALGPQRHQAVALRQARRCCNGERERQRAASAKSSARARVRTLGGRRERPRVVHDDLSQPLHQRRLRRQLEEEAATAPRAHAAAQHLRRAKRSVRLNTAARRREATRVAAGRTWTSRRQ